MHPGDMGLRDIYTDDGTVVLAKHNNQPPNSGTDFLRLRNALSGA